MMRRARIRIAASIWLTLGAGPAAGGAAVVHETQADVTAAILAALPKGDGSVAEITPSAAARMARCLGPLTVSMMGPGDYRTAQVGCPAPRWTLYVEVSLVRMEAVLVATGFFPMGHRLAAGDFRSVRMASNDVAGEPVSASDVVGKEAAAPLAPGETITRNQIIIPFAVHNGDEVIIHWFSPSVTASAAGTALQSGGLGQSILVENGASHRRITAVILAEGGPATEGQPFIVAPQ
jgi:flagellar basal body P-ring formation protein FlgA